MAKISSLDSGYESGDLSVYPEAIDNKSTLYEAKNNAKSILEQGLTYNAKKIIVSDASTFPQNGLIRIGEPKEKSKFEIIFYSSRTDKVLSGLTRGMAGSIQSSWPKGSKITNAVMAEHHNATKDAILNIQNLVGTSVNPDLTSINGRLKILENKFLAPKPIFRAFPLKGKPSLKVRFQNFSEGDAIRFLWDFGDGSSSIEKSPTHTYSNEGIYTVKLNVITSTGAQGFSVKNNYITVSNDEIVPFFYYELVDNSQPAYSIETAAELSEDPGVFRFVDQTEGEIAQRFWIFGDGENEAVLDPDIHTITHTYTSPGTYEPELIIILANETPKRIFLTDSLEVL